MKAPYPQQARRHMSQIGGASKTIAAALIKWAAHPTEAPDAPHRFCPALDGRDATAHTIARHDAQDCKWCDYCKASTVENHALGWVSIEPIGPYIREPNRHACSVWCATKMLQNARGIAADPRRKDGR